MLGQVRVDLGREGGNSGRSPHPQRSRRGVGRGRGLGPGRGMRHQLFEHMREGTHPGVGPSVPVCPPLGSLTLGPPYSGSTRAWD